jgi:hypothetical protein
VVIVKDLNWGASSPALQDLVDTGDGKVGVRVATSISNPWYNSNFLDPSFGNDRYGPVFPILVTSPPSWSKGFCKFERIFGSVGPQVKIWKPFIASRKAQLHCVSL